MPRVPDQYLDSVVYLYPSVEAAEAGEDQGACGFTVRVRLKVQWGNYYPYEVYVVTNRHVIDHGNRCVRANTLRGGFTLVETGREDWVTHPHGYDLTVCPVWFREEEWNLIAIPESDFFDTFFRAGMGHWTRGRRVPCAPLLPTRRSSAKPARSSHRRCLLDAKRGRRCV